MSTFDEIVRIVLQHYPASQAIYLFGTHGTVDEWPDSDADIAILLPPEESRGRRQLMLAPCRYALEDALGKSVDLLNVREVSTVFQKEIVGSGRRLYATDDGAADEFEMLTLSHYQKLNDERQAILKAFRESGRAYAV